MTIWRNLNIQNKADFRIFREPSKEVEEHLGSAEPRLKNAALMTNYLVLDFTFSIGLEKRFFVSEMKGVFFVTVE